VDLAGKTCLVTGGASGIGEATSRLFAWLGAEVLVVDIDSKNGARLQRSVSGGEVKFKKVDLTRTEALDFTRWADANYDKLDVLVNNASRPIRSSVLDTRLDVWRKMLELNLASPFILSKFAAQKIIKNGVKGKIRNVSSIQAVRPLESSFLYATTKGGLVSLTRSIAVDLGLYGILVVSVLIGGPVYVARRGSRGRLKEVDRRAATLLGRMGRKEEVAKLMAFLALDENTFITGSETVIDGGRLVSRLPDPMEVSSKAPSDLFGQF
jgi:NAD(P)-dependent dehydrogenase (short-subunit alcohol dehydrogenase family)